MVGKIFNTQNPPSHTMLFYSRLIQWNPSITKKNKRGEREEGEGVGDMMILFNNQGLIRRESGWGGGGREEGGGG